MKPASCFSVLVSCFALLMISGCATAPGHSDNSAAHLQDVGEKYLAAGETADALKYLTEAEEKKSGDPTIEYDLALAYDQRQMPDKAVLHLEKALQIKPSYPEALNAMGSIYAKRGQLEPARAAFQKALDDPFYKTPQIAAYNLGRLYEKEGNSQRALPYYQQAAKIDEHYGMAWFSIGRVMEQLHRDDEARHAYGNAVHESPGLAEAQLRFGILSYQASDLDAALDSLSRVGKIAPNTDMADEARRYIEKLKSEAARTRGHASSHVFRGEEMEMNSNDQSRREFTEEELPPGAVKAAAVDESAPAQAGTANGLESQSYRYMVELGSFVDKEKAEQVKANLLEKGYSATVKSRKDQALGEIFVIQFGPVASLSKATTLMTQLGGEIEGQPVIVKVPAR
ncbi:exported hypothetical protein [Syntrophobacter sp. SbD1]|nr:exported hypothetical protein [Syntrophobacter sp. SbD1]